MCFIDHWASKVRKNPKSVNLLWDIIVKHIIVWPSSIWTSSSGQTTCHLLINGTDIMVYNNLFVRTQFYWILKPLPVFEISLRNMFVFVDGPFVVGVWVRSTNVSISSDVCKKSAKQDKLSYPTLRGLKTLAAATPPLLSAQKMFSQCNIYMFTDERMESSAGRLCHLLLPSSPLFRDKTRAGYQSEILDTCTNTGSWMTLF